MKKTIFFILLSFAVSGLIFSQDIQIKEPAPGKTYHTGKTCPVKWTKPKDLHTSVKLTLRNPNQSLNSVITMSTPNNGYYLWNIPPSLKPGEYILRVKTIDNKFSGNSGIFSVKKPGADIGIIELEAFQPPPDTNTPRHRAPAIRQPSGASFHLKKLHAGVNEQGKMEKCGLVVKYTSKTPFAFIKYKGHPSDGPAYMNCKIILPVWSKDPNYKGPVKTKVIFNHRFSVRYKGKNHMECAPAVLDAGSGEFELIFKPVHSEKVRSLYTKQKMPKGNPWQGHDDWCMKTYPPKMALRLFIHTKEGVKQMYKEFYFHVPDSDSYTIPGEINMCSGGTVYW